MYMFDEDVPVLMCFILEMYVSNYTSAHTLQATFRSARHPIKNVRMLKTY